MSQVFRIHPHPQGVPLRDVLAPRGLGDGCEEPVLSMTVRHVDVEPARSSWRIWVRPNPSMGRVITKDQYTQLGERLVAQIPCVRHVDWVVEPSNGQGNGNGAVEAAAASEALAVVQPAEPTAYNGSSTVEEPEDDLDAYMEMIAKRAREWVGMQETERNGDSARAKKSGNTNEVLMGRRVAEEPVPIREVQDEERSVVVEGEVISVDLREMRSGRTLVTFDLTDGSDSISAKVFETEPVLAGAVRPGDWLRVRGGSQFDRFTNELTLMPRDCMRVPAPPQRMDEAQEKRVELHLHTKMSALDGAVEVDHLIRLASEWGHPAVAITDHGVVQAFPEAYDAAAKAGIKLIYGVEGYLVETPAKESKMYHVVLLATNQTGLRNLYRLVSISHMHYFYRRPRIPKEELEKYREGIMVGSACEAGELYQAILHGEPDERIESIARYYDYLEIQPLDNNGFLIDEGIVKDDAGLQAINKRIVALGEQLGKPVIASGDVHFLKPEDEIFRQIIMAGHGFDVERATPLYLRTTDEMLEEFSYLGQEKAYDVVVTTPRWVADQVEDMRPVPDGFHPPHLEGAEEEIRSMSVARAKELYGEELPDLVAKRLEKELSSIIDNGYASLYLIAHKLVKRSLDDGYLVGSRGSVGSSFVATMCEITEVNPLPPHYICPSCHRFEVFEDGSVAAGIDLPEKACPDCGSALTRDGYDIPFETFMGFHGDKVPDIDLNFSGDYQPKAHKYAEQLFGSDKVYRAGTIGRLAERTAYGYVRNFLDSRGVQARNAEINRLVRGCSGVRRTTGQHPGGLMVVPPGRDIFEFTPIQHPANDGDTEIITTHFDCETIKDTLVKLDILGHDDPTMLRVLQDITGVEVRQIPINDPKTLSLFSSLDALGIDEKGASGVVATLAVPEFGTRFVRQMLVDTRPTSVGELIRISGLSHGTNVWTGNAQELIREKTSTLKDVIATRDDIMTALIRHGLTPGDAFAISESVRKGKGVSDEHEQTMLANGVPKWYIESCRKISYLFPKAHAAAYVMMALRIAYFKVHHPEAFYSAYFTIRAAADFDAALVASGESGCRRELERLEAKGNDASAKEKGVITVLEVVLEAMARGVRFLPVDLYRSEVERFSIEDGSLRCPFSSLQGVGKSAAQAIVAARDERAFTSIEDLQRRSKVSKTVIETLSEHGTLSELPETDQIALF